MNYHLFEEVFTILTPSRGPGLMLEEERVEFWLDCLGYCEFGPPKAAVPGMLLSQNWLPHELPEDLNISGASASSSIFLAMATM